MSHRIERSVRATAYPASPTSAADEQVAVGGHGGLAVGGVVGEDHHDVAPDLLQRSLSQTQRAPESSQRRSMRMPLAA
jgi:hypothetical protein